MRLLIEETSYIWPNRQIRYIVILLVLGPECLSLEILAGLLNHSLTKLDAEKVTREFEEEMKYSIMNLRRIKTQKVYPIPIYGYSRSRSILRNGIAI